MQHLLQQVTIQMQERQRKWNKQMQTGAVYNKNYARNNCINKIANIPNKHQQETNVSVNNKQHVPSLQSVRACDTITTNDVATSHDVGLQPLVTR